MPVTDFECQIARGQIGRYLGGGALSPEAMRGLEEHLAECPGCKSLVSDRRAALLGMLGGDIPTRAVVSMPVTEENPLLAALRAKQEEEEDEEIVEAPKPKAAARYAGAKPKTETQTGKPVMTKPLLLGGLLAIVLLGMNFMSRANNGKGALGGHASDSFAAETLTSKPAETKTPEAAKPAVPIAAEPSVQKPQPTYGANADSAETPKPNYAVAKSEPPKPEPPKPEAPKPAAEKPKIEKPKVEKPVVEEKPKVEKPVVHPLVPKKPAVHAKKIVRRAAVRKKRVAARKVRVKRTPRTSVRVYGLDGQPLKN